MGNDIDLHLGKRLRRRRRLLGLTQQQLAGACGVRFQQIQKYECGANRISAARLWQLSEALEVPVGYFYDGLTNEERAQQAAEQRQLHLDPHFGERDQSARELAEQGDHAGAAGLELGEFAADLTGPSVEHRVDGVG